MSTGVKMGILDSLFGGKKETAAASAPAAPAASNGETAPASNGGDGAWDTISAAQRMACPVAPIEEDEATGEIAEIYDAVKKAMQVPVVPNIDKILANSPQALKGTVGLMDDLYMASSLPQPVVAMLLYSISLARSCQYCSSFHRLTCRMVGVDESMLAAVGNNLGSVTPERVQAIVAFGVKAAMSSNELTDGDFDKLRDMGISDAEIVEIVALSGMGVYLNIVADALKIEVDDMIKQGLAA
ncbi:MAG: putative peroxidase-related enzyme [Alphaproteobacteria bacterium]|jgi:uncharacterized peroxidase-related enzyme